VLSDAGTAARPHVRWVIFQVGILGGSCRGWASPAQSVLVSGSRQRLLYIDDIPAVQETHLRTSTDRYGDSFTLLYVDEDRTLQETHLRASTACYGYSFTLLYVDEVRTLQETHLRASTACYGDSFTFYM
jgi:hypothetical protein